MKENILEEFKHKKSLFTAFKERMINLLKDLIEKEDIHPHQIVGRTKTFDSLVSKIDKKGEKYTQLSDITDIVGLRVITYLEDDVDRVAAIIEREFRQDESNTIDKRILKIDQFGYKSLHIVVSLDNNRIKLSEYSAFKEIKCEIQIRSILQHAWAEIEHDLGYKGQDIPDNYKRAFNRVAALLELADIEFVKLKVDLGKYEKNISELIKSKPEEVDINKASISAFIQDNLIISRIRKLISEETGFQLRKDDNYDLTIAVMKYFNINSIQNLQSTLKDNEQGYKKFLKSLIVIRNFKRVLSENVVLIYFGHYLAAKNDNSFVLEMYLEAFMPDKVDELTQDLLKAYDNSKGY